jgi:RimJ/RimL family protein N-acetyltransferase
MAQAHSRESGCFSLREAAIAFDQRLYYRPVCRLRYIHIHRKLHRAANSKQHAAIRNTIQTMLETERLLLRRWKMSDRAPFAEINADPQVMEFFPGTLTRDESDALIDRFESHFENHGFGLYAVELKGEGQFVGFMGLHVTTFQAHFTPAVEIGWRMGLPFWNKGFATEGSREVIRFAFERLRLDALVSFTVPHNLASRKVMEKLGMTHDPADDFDHPRLPEGHRLRRHVLYRLRNPQLSF